MLTKHPLQDLTKQDLCTEPLPASRSGDSETQGESVVLVLPLPSSLNGWTQLALLMLSCLPLCRLTFQDSLLVQWPDSPWQSKVGFAAWRTRWTDPSGRSWSVQETFQSLSISGLFNWSWMFYLRRFIIPLAASCTACDTSAAVVSA